MAKFDVIELKNKNVDNNKSFTIRGKLPKNHPRDPNWIGKDYQIKNSSLPSSSSSSSKMNLAHRSSPRTHWRRGHWRFQPYGNKEKPEYKNIWIEPTIISG